MINQILILLTLLIFLVLDLYTMATRAAYSQTSHARLLALREQKGERINRVIQLSNTAQRLRACLNLLLVFTRFTIASLVILGLLGFEFLYPHFVGVFVLLVVSLVVFYLEWVTETSILKNPEKWALILYPFARITCAIFAPFLFPFKLSGGEQHSAESGGAVTENELKTLVDAGQQDGVFEKDERRMIYSIFDLGDTVAREIMVPRIDMLALELNTTIEAAADKLLAAGHSRIPVFEDSIDNMVGLLYAKDLLRAWREESKPKSLRSMLRKAYFVPEAKKVDELLAEMQSMRIHMAIVVDEYGGVAGLVTLEDIVEEILGEIQDEYDQGEEAPFQKLKDGSYLFLGRITLDDFNDIMGSTLSSEDADTLGGYIYDRLAHVPEVGEKVIEDNIILTVEQVSARRIRKVSASWIESAGREKEKDNVDR